MASTWIETRVTTTSGKPVKRYRVIFRVGGREQSRRYGGSFKTMREAKERRNAIAGDLAALRVPELHPAEVAAAVTLAAAAERWRASRVDVSEGTMTTYRVAIGRLVPRLGSTAVDGIDAQTVADLVAELHGDGLRKQTIRKTVSVLAMVLDHAGVVPNPARDRLTVKLPREDRAEVEPPEPEHVEAVYRLLPRAYRLPLLALDASGMRVGELEALTWRAVDEPGSRWRVSKAVAKTRRSRWVPFDPDKPAGDVFAAVAALVPREDRDLEAPVFAGFDADALRTAISRACKAAGVPAFSPHDLRHRRATLWHLQGVPPAEAAAWLGHSSQEHLNTYAHATLVDRREIDYAKLLERARVVPSPVPPPAVRTP